MNLIESQARIKQALAEMNDVMRRLERDLTTGLHGYAVCRVCNGTNDVIRDWSTGDAAKLTVRHVRVSWPHIRIQVQTELDERVGLKELVSYTEQNRRPPWEPAGEDERAYADREQVHLEKCGWHELPAVDNEPGVYL